MTGSLGARLKLQRERQGVSLTTIAETTKIKASLLEDLERDDLSHWPAGIFRRSYLRAYAHAVGLDPDPVVREFLTLHPEPAEQGAAIEALAQSAGPGARRRPPTRLSYLLSSAINALPSLRGTSVSHATATAADTSLFDAQAIFDFAQSGSPSRFASPEAPFAVADDNIALNDSAPGLDEASLPDREPQHDIDQAPDDTSALPSMPKAAQIEVTMPQAPATMSTVSHAPHQPLELEAIAELCTRLGRAGHVQQVEQFMEHATGLLGAIGIILWTWDSSRAALQPALSHGYSEELLAHIPPVTAHADNAIASAFRSAQTCLVTGDDQGSGAVAVPLMTPFGCAGVLAAEFRDRGEQRDGVRAVLTIFGAQLSTLVGQPPVIRTA